MSPRPSQLSGILRRAEAMAVSGTVRHWALIPEDLSRRLRPQVVRVGDGVLTLLERSDSLRLNRVVGLGHEGRAKESMLDTVIERYRSAKIRRFSVLLGPGPQFREISRWLLARRFRPHGGHTLLLRDLRRPIPRVGSGVRVARMRARDQETVFRILAEAFGVPSSRKGWSLAALAAPGYEHYLAYAGRSPAAVGALRIENGLAWLGGGATRTRWRRRGAHAALITARLKRASALGSSWAWSETALPVAGQPQGSRRNLMRLGFEEAWTKPAYVWQG